MTQLKPERQWALDVVDLTDQLCDACGTPLSAVLGSVIDKEEPDEAKNMVAFYRAYLLSHGCSCPISPDHDQRYRDRIVDLHIGLPFAAGDVPGKCVVTAVVWPHKDGGIQSSFYTSRQLSKDRRLSTDELSASANRDLFLKLVEFVVQHDQYIRPFLKGRLTIPSATS